MSAVLVRVVRVVRVVLMQCQVLPGYRQNPGYFCGRARPNGSRAQFEGKHNLERCRFLVLDFMVVVRFVLVLTFSDIC